MRLFVSTDSRQQQHVQTYANGNAKFKSIFQIYCFKKTAEFFYVPPLWEKKRKRFDFFFFPPNGCRRRNLFFLVANCQHGDRNQLVRRSTLDLDIDSAHGQPARYLARPTSIDDGLEDIRWIHGLGVESLSAASYGILPNLKKKTIICHSRRMEKFFLLFCANQRPIVFLSYAWSVPATKHRPWCEDGDPRVGRSP